MILHAFLLIQFVFCSSQQLLNSLKQANCLNCDELPKNVGFKDFRHNPYPFTAGYDTKIDETVNCYVLYLGGDDYELKQLSATQANEFNRAGETLYMTHTGHCGVCSTMQDLAVYLEYPNLTDPVKICSYKLIKSHTLACLKSLGFSNHCAHIWLYNISNTRRFCVINCLYNIRTSKNSARPDIFGNPCAKDVCRNTINGKPTCYPEASQQGSELRLNACLQCDECSSGPVFQKISGRTRRNSGIESEIKRPNNYISKVDHLYGILFGNKA